MKMRIWSVHRLRGFIHARATRSQEQLKMLPKINRITGKMRMYFLLAKSIYRAKILHHADCSSKSQHPDRCLPQLVISNNQNK